MKKNLVIIIALSLFLINSSFAQFSAGYTNAGNLITFKIRPSVTTTTGFSVFEFFVRYPDNSPAFTYGTPVAYAANFPGMTVNQTTGQGAWEIEVNNPAYQIAGYHVDHILYTAPAPATGVTTYNAGQEYNVVSFPVIGAAGSTVNFELVHQSTEASFYLALTSEVGGDVRPAAPGDYFFPTTSQVAGPDGSTVYYSALAVPLPVKFTGFNAFKKDNDAMLSWQVENESSLTDRYEVERSLNGADFKKAYTVAAKNNGNTKNTYGLADLNLSAIRSSGIFYYRVKQIDKDGRSVYTDVKSVRLTRKGIVIGLFPNPVKSFTNITIDVEQNADAIITLHDAAGKLLRNIQMQLFKGPNIKKIDMESLSAGSYMLRVQTATETTTIPVVKTN